VATLSYPTEPIPVTAIAEISDADEPPPVRHNSASAFGRLTIDHALRSGGSKVVQRS
jgi:hypothetical protein